MNGGQQQETAAPGSRKSSCCSCSAGLASCWRGSAGRRCQVFRCCERSWASRFYAKPPDFKMLVTNSKIQPPKKHLQRTNKTPQWAGFQSGGTSLRPLKARGHPGVGGGAALSPSTARWGLGARRGFSTEALLGRNLAFCLWIFIFMLSNSQQILEIGTRMNNITRFRVREWKTGHLAYRHVPEFRYPDVLEIQCCTPLVFHGVLGKTLTLTLGSLENHSSSLSCKCY